MLSRTRHRGFTLIELLVVIAIIAILASILFPVFAQAREKARAITCLSQIKQLGLAVQMYNEDYDETMVPVLVSGGWFSTERVSWDLVVYPYIKSKTYGGGSMFHCPDLEEDFYHEFSASGPPTTADWWVSYFSNYGMNLDYLQPDPSCDPNQANPQLGAPFGYPVNLARIEAAAQTIMIVETKPEVLIAGGCTGCFYPTDQVDSPASYPGFGSSNAHACALDGWGYNDAFEGGSQGIGGPTGFPPTGTNTFAPRHQSGGNVVFCDGHVKRIVPGQAAAGTSWSPQSADGSVQITDLTQYLWSLNKSGTSDL